MRRHARVTIAIAALAAFLTCVATASAGYVNTASFSGPGSDPGQLDHPGRAAIEPSTGNLFVADSGNDRVNVYEPDGSGGMTYLTSFGSGELDAPYGIAIDEDAGQTALYVSDSANNRIVKYDSDEATTPAFTLDGSFSLTGGIVADYRASLAVDPTTHDLLVADYANELIHRFEADGTFDSSFDGSNGGTELDGPLDVAVNSSGDVIVLDATGTIEEVIGFAATTRIERYSSTGAHEATIGPISDESSALAVVPGTDQLLVAGNAWAYWGSSPKVYRFAADNTELGAFEATAASQSLLTGVAGTTPGGQIYAISDQPLHDDTGTVGGLVFEERPAPAVTITAPDGITASSATLHGEVDPNEVATSWRFEYSTDQSTWEWGPSGDAGGGASPVAVEGTLGGLEPNKTYYVRLVATSAAGETTSAGPNLSFATDPVAPGLAAALFPAMTYSGGTTATVGSYVNPRNSATSYWVEYGPTTSYGTSVPAGQDADAGSVNKPVAVDLQIDGLTPESTYHYRIVAESTGGITHGPDQSFETLAAIAPRGPCPNEAIRIEQGSTFLSDCRAWEKVTPDDKGGVDVAGVTYEGKIRAAASGGRLVYSSLGQFANSIGGGLPSLYMAQRGPEGWTTNAALPKSSSRGGFIGFGGTGPGRTATLPWVDDELQTSIVEATGTMAPGSEEGVAALYKRSGIDGPFEPISPVGANIEEALLNQDLMTTLNYASGDGRHVVFQSAWNYETDEPGQLVLYQVDTETSELKIAARLPNGDPAVDAHPGSFGYSMHHALSEDGSRLYFGDYLRDGDEPTEVAVPGGRFLAATPDGGKALYIAHDSSVNEPGVFIYDAETGSSESISTGIGGVLDSVPRASEDLKYVYMTVNGGEGGLPDMSRNFSLYLWHDGELRRIATIADARGSYTPGFVNGPYDYPGNYNAWFNNPAVEVSPDGKTLVFVTSARLTGYDNDGVTQVYRYDAETDEVRCVSCPLGEATGNATLTAPNQLEGAPAGPNGRNLGVRNAVSRDGKRVFFSTPEALVEEDTNGLFDVYVDEGEGARLISSGTSKSQTRFTAASGSGDEAFIATAERLSRADQDDLVDIYVAKVSGGYPEPPFPGAPCQGEACQPAIPAAPGSASVTTNNFSGAGNPPVKRGCAKPRNQKKKRQGAGKRASAGKSQTRASAKNKNKGRANCKRRAGK